jgi:hypothetical protein
MDKDRKRRFATLMNWLAEKYPLGDSPRRLSTSDIADYYMVLSDMRIERLEWAAKWIFGHNRFFPKPAELRTAAEMAPSSIVQITQPDRKQIADSYTPTKEEREMLRELASGLDDKYGSRLAEIIGKG